jgi:hypothetical protein
MIVKLNYYDPPPPPPDVREDKADNIPVVVK